MMSFTTARVRLDHWSVAVAFALAAGACAGSDKPVDTLGARAPDTTRVTRELGSIPGTADVSVSGKMASAPRDSMTGDADHDFLRMMSDHHRGLIVLAHLTKDRKDGGTAVSDAKKLDAAQDTELDQMVTMLEKDFKDPYAPRVMPEHQAMADELKGKTGKDYDRAFYQNVITHHQQAIVMIDGYLPRAKNATVRRMAEKMKADQAKEIADFQQKVARLGT